ncbi:MAG TPA: Gfo/Idh/MocA family oxidoreductase [Pirellulales bacterium]|jgi:predicted dehydrogenase|nr:Gfo/Idh/MocA family oxidoreductase [Pirellulales bacterium]
MTLPLRVALIGAGAIARSEHLPAWMKLPEFKVVAMADPSPVSLSAVPGEFDIRRRVADYRELIDDPDIDVVDICVPSALHAEVAIAALAAGKHVLCEKPMATSRPDAAAILDAWRASGKKLMIGQHMRFEPSVVQLRAYLQRNPPGDIYYTRGQWLRRRRLPARPGFTDRRLSGGGALYDLGVHMLDLAWWLTGCPRPSSISGQTFNRLARRRDLGSEWGTWEPTTIDVEDFAVGLVRFTNGSALSLEVSWLGFQPEEEFWRLQLYGSHAGISWPQCQLVGEDQLIPWNLQLAEAKGDKAHHQVIREFARSVLEDLPVPVPPEQSANIIAMLDALYASAASGREAPVEPFESGGDSG